MNRRSCMSILTLTAIVVSGSALAKDEPRYPFDQDNTPGWVLMNPAEQTEYGKRMLGFKTYDDCKAYEESHRKQMEQRANERHTTLRPPSTDACDGMKARGLIK